jgi:hypothetical protein
MNIQIALSEGVKPIMHPNTTFKPSRPAVEANISIKQVPNSEKWEVVIDEMRVTGTLPQNIVDNPDPKIRYAKSTEMELMADFRIRRAIGKYQELLRNVKRMLNGLEVIDEHSLIISIDEALGHERIKSADPIPDDEYNAALAKTEEKWKRAVNEGNQLDFVPVTEAEAEAAVAYFKRELATMVQAPIGEAFWAVWQEYAVIAYSS